MKHDKLIINAVKRRTASSARGRLALGSMEAASSGEAAEGIHHEHNGT